VKLFGNYSDFIALQKFIRDNFTKVQVPWVKILTLKMPLGLLSKRPKVVSPVHILFSSKSKQTPIFGPFFTKIWSNAKEHLPSQYFNSRDLTFKNLASKFSKWLKLSNLMPCPSAGSKQFWTSPYCFGQVQKDFQSVKLLPCPFTGPKIFWAGPNFLSRTKKLLTYFAGPKLFVPDQEMIFFY